MTTGEYEQFRRALSIKFDKDVDELKLKYALSNSTVGIGDVITDGVRKITVDSIKSSTFVSSTPYCIYHGVTEKGAKVTISQHDLK